MAPHRDKLEDMDVPLEMCASLKGPTHEKLKSGQIYFRASFGICKSWIFGTICRRFHAFMSTRLEMRAF